jgi:hypothetical protein
MHIGSGWLVTVLLLLPNALFVLFKPVDALPEEADKGKTMQIMENLERVGQAGSFLLPIFYDFQLGTVIGKIALACMVVALSLYYLCWARFFLRGRCFWWLYAPLWGIPLPMAVFPVLFLFAASAVLRSIPLAAATAVLAVGHLSVSAHEHERVRQAEQAVAD